MSLILPQSFATVALVLLLASPFVSARASGEAAPVWGPLEQGSCTGTAGFRRYRATLHGAEGDACGGPFLNVMGARFDHPDGCDGMRGYWDVRDHTCAAAPPVLPGRGADGGVDVPAEGYADLHNHLLAHVAFGETVLWGRSYGEPADVLKPIPSELRSAHQRIEAFGSSQSLAGVFGSHDESGHPSYSGWPTPHLKTHQQTHVDWLFRAYQGGLRLVVVNAVNNQDMFGRGENPIGFLNKLMGLIGARATPAEHRTSNDMEALEHQVLAAHDLVRWVREHRGGWLEVAETPEEASALIASGKMALVLGSEVDHPFNCDLGRRCSDAHIREGLTKLEAMGFAIVFPTHHKETQFGDSAHFHPLGTGPLRSCPAFKMDCAAAGLAPKGELLVKEMMARGMLADLGHAGDLPFDQTMRLFEAERYPTLMSHASAHPLRPNGSAEYTLTYEQLRRIDAVGGMASIHGAEGEYAGMHNEGATIPFGCEDGAGAYVQSYRYMVDAMGGGTMDPSDPSRGGQVAIAPDWNGFASWPDGRFREGACLGRRVEATGEPVGHPEPIEYPFALPQSLVPAAVGATASLDVMEFEGHAYDFNQRGLAHAGLQADLLEDMRLHGLSEADLDPFFRSARGFVEMWRRARDARIDGGDRGSLRWVAESPTDLVSFDGVDASRWVEVAPGAPICRLRGSGSIGALRGGVCELVEGEPYQEPKEIRVGEIRNANSGQCLSVARESSRGGARVRQESCSGAPHQQWQFAPEESGSARGELRAEHSGLCLGQAGHHAVQDDCAELPPVTLERIGNTFRIRPNGDACLQTRGRRLDSGAPVGPAACAPPGRADFHWEIDGLRDAREAERLFSVRSLDGTVEWQAEGAALLPHAVATGAGVPLCRAEGQLGLVSDGKCRLRDGDVRTVGFERLRAAEPLIHTR